MIPPGQPTRESKEFGAWSGTKTAPGYGTSPVEQSGFKYNMHLLAAEGDLEGLLKGYLADQNILACDEQGNTPLHMAAMHDQRSAARGLIALGMPEVSWKIKNKDGITPFDMATRRIRMDMQLISMKKAEIVDKHTLYNKKLVEERLANLNENHKVLLSIDGGGIKAILIAGVNTFIIYSYRLIDYLGHRTSPWRASDEPCSLVGWN